MKLQLPAAELKQALTGLLKIIPRKASLSILHGVRLDAAENTVRLTATDLESTVYYTCPSATVLEPGLVVIADARRLKELINHATKDKAEFIVADEKTVCLTLRGELGEREHLLPTADFVDWPADPKPMAIEDVEPRFLKCYQSLVSVASTDASRAVLNGVYVDVDGGARMLVSTDGRRLAAYPFSSLPVYKSCIIPTNKFLASVKADGPYQLGISIDHTRFQVEIGPWSCIGKTIEGTFPNWRQVVPKEGACGLDLHEDDLPILDEVVRTFPVSDKTSKPLYIEPHGTRARLSALDPDTGQWSHRALPMSNCYGKGTCVNRDYLRDAVKAGFHQFRWQDELSPLVAHDKDGGTFVLMPLRSDAPPKAKSRSPKPQTNKPQKENKPVIKPKEATQPEADAGSVEQLWLSYQTVRDRVRDLNTALSELGDQLRDAKKADKSVRAELKNARGVLAKLQNISI